jgi:hypothetical protein
MYLYIRSGSGRRVLGDFFLAWGLILNIFNFAWPVRGGSCKLTGPCASIEREFVDFGA